MGILEGLPGTKKTFEIEEFGYSVSDLLRLLKRDGVSTAANDNGAINVYKDDEGFYRAERCVHRHCVGSITTKKIGELERWLKKNYKFIL